MMTVRGLLIFILTSTFVILLSVILAVEIGFVQSEYTVSEFNQSVMVCVELQKGSLGVPIHLSLTTHNITAQGESIYNFKDLPE